MKKEMQEARRLLAAFAKYAADFPASPHYKQTVHELQQKVADLANQIGRPAKRNK